MVSLLLTLVLPNNTDFEENVLQLVILRIPHHSLKVTLTLRNSGNLLTKKLFAEAFYKVSYTFLCKRSILQPYLKKFSKISV